MNPQGGPFNKSAQLYVSDANFHHELIDSIIGGHMDLDVQIGSISTTRLLPATQHLRRQFPSYNMHALNTTRVSTEAGVAGSWLVDKGPVYVASKPLHWSGVPDGKDVGPGTLYLTPSTWVEVKVMGKRASAMLFTP